MAEEIPIARENTPDDGQTSKVLDQTQLVGSAFDEDVLSDIENRLDGGEALPPDYSPRDKVELDKADLPLDFGEPEPEPAKEPGPEAEPEVAVDLAIDAPAKEPPPPPGFLKANLHWVAAGGALLVLVVTIAAWLAGGGSGQRAEKKPTPWIVRGRIISPEKNLRMDLDPFLVQLARTNQGQILQVSVSLEVMQPPDLRHLRAKLAQCRDVIYRTLTGRTAAELASRRGKDLIRARIQAALNQALGSERVYKVYFTKFLISG